MQSIGQMSTQASHSMQSLPLKTVWMSQLRQRSASANELFAKAILRMGVPVSPRNIFPSNIQGLPTWYEVRVSEAGWAGAAAST